MKQKILIASLCVVLVVLLGVIIVANIVQNNSASGAEETLEQTEEVTVPDDETQESVDVATNPVDETEVSTEVPTNPVDVTEVPTEVSTEPSNAPTTEPATEPVQATNPPTKPTEGNTSHENPANKTEENETTTLPLFMDSGIAIVDLGNYAGMYVEDGSDTQIDSVAGVVLENTSGHTIQLVQFTLTFGQDTYEFRVTTLPHGARVLVQEMNKKSFKDVDQNFTAAISAIAHFQQEPSLHTDVFSVTGTETGIELRNLTDKDIAGPIYVYYKTRNSDGYAGGITYRLTIPELKAKSTYAVNANHFWIGSSEIMFIDYAQ